MKAAIDEFESKLEELRVRGVEAQEVEQNVVITTKKAAGRKGGCSIKMEFVQLIFMIMSGLVQVYYSLRFIG